MVTVEGEWGHCSAVAIGCAYPSPPPPSELSSKSKMNFAFSSYVALEEATCLSVSVCVGSTCTITPRPKILQNSSKVSGSTCSAPPLVATCVSMRFPQVAECFTLLPKCLSSSNETVPLHESPHTQQRTRPRGTRTSAMGL